ncbi:MAG: hypothetical protein SCALA702_23620 [Melioribacteraceae bacterium]|nr:MAG: hypothetical protein SCALA702_23620 [Melioribacteraceae bacterium]
MESQRFLVLKNNKLLKNININQLSDRQLLGQLLAINEGEFVYNQNEEAEFVYLVVSGKVKLVGSESEWNDVIYTEGDAFGMDKESSGLIDHSAVALQDTYLVQLSYPEYEFIQGLPKLEDSGYESSLDIENNLLASFDIDNPDGENEELSFDDSLPYNFDEMNDLSEESDEPEEEVGFSENEESEDGFQGTQNIEEDEGVTDESAEFETVEELPESYPTTEDHLQYSETDAEIVTINDEAVEEDNEEESTLGNSYLIKFAEAVNILNEPFLVKDTYEKLLEAACFLTDSDRGVIFIPNERGGFTSVCGEEKSEIQTGLGLSGWAVQKGEPVIVNDVKTSKRFNAEYDEPPEYQTKSMIVLPVKGDDHETKLIYQLFNNEDGNFTDEHVLGLKAIYKVANRNLDKAVLFEADLKKQRISALRKIAGFMDNDIKKPVLVSKRYIEHLRGGYLPDNVDKVLNMMSGNLDSVVDLLKTISDYTSGNLKLRLSPLYVNRFLKDFISSREPNLSEKNISIRFALDNECKVKLDNTRFGIVVNNILTNAANAMPEGGELVISTFVESDFVKISIRDKGKGIPQDILDYIFEPFISSEMENSGLGLFICKIIVEEHRGTIRITDTGEKGTEITLRMPLDKNF